MVTTLKPWQGLILAIVFFIVGCCLLIYSVKTINDYNEKSKTYIDVVGYVVDYEYDEPLNSNSLAAEIVEYEIDGKTYKVTSNTSSNTPRSRGSEVKLKYNPDNPNDVIWVNDSFNYILPIVGTVFTVLGIILSIQASRKIKNNEIAM